MFESGANSPVDVRDARVEQDPARTLHPPDHALDGSGEADLVQLVGSQIVGDLLELGARLLGEQLDFVELVPGIVIPPASPAAPGAGLDDAQVLPQRIVHLVRDPAALVLERVDQLLRERPLRAVLAPQARDAALVGKDSSARRHGRQRDEPRRAPQRRRHHDVHARAAGVPHPVVVGGDDLEAVAARRHTVVDGRSPHRARPPSLRPARRAGT